MGEPTPVNGQITDAITQSNVKVIDEAPAIEMGNIEQQQEEEVAGENEEDQG